MSVLTSRSLLVALLGSSLLPALQVRAQVGVEPVGPSAEPVVVPSPPQRAVLMQRSGLWQTVEAEYRRPAEVADTNPHRLSEAQRQELRDQIRRAALRTDSPQLAPVVSRP